MIICTKTTIWKIIWLLYLLKFNLIIPRPYFWKYIQYKIRDKIRYILFPIKVYDKNVKTYQNFRLKRTDFTCRNALNISSTLLYMKQHGKGVGGWGGGAKCYDRPKKWVSTPTTTLPFGSNLYKPLKKSLPLFATSYVYFFKL